MEQHPIESIMTSTLENIKDMIDVNTVVGKPVLTTDGSTIIPISRVSVGFVVGGGEYEYASKKGSSANGGSEKQPFAGGSSAGVSVQPMGFLIINKDQVKMLPAQYYATTVDRIIELVPQLMCDVKKWIHEEIDTVDPQPKQMTPDAEL